LAEKGLVSFDLLKTWAKAHLREDSRLRAMILDEQGSVSRAEMIVKLDMYACPGAEALDW
jgi:hypothetical protein